MQRRFNSKKFTELGAVLEKVLQQYRPKQDQALLRVWDIWEKAVDSAMAANARPAAFKGSILLVHVSNSIWLHHLRFMEKELIARINQALGAESVHTIRLKIGPI